MLPMELFSFVLFQGENYSETWSQIQLGTSVMVSVEMTLWKSILVMFFKAVTQSLHKECACTKERLCEDTGR